MKRLLLIIGITAVLVGCQAGSDTTTNNSSTATPEKEAYTAFQDKCASLKIPSIQNRVTKKTNKTIVSDCYENEEKLFTLSHSESTPAGANFLVASYSKTLKEVEDIAYPWENPTTKETQVYPYPMEINFENNQLILFGSDCGSLKNDICAEDLRKHCKQITFGFDINNKKLYQVSAGTLSVNDQYLQQNFPQLYEDRMAKCQ